MAVELRLSGGEFNSNPNGALGGQRSDTVITTDVLENLFDNISRSEALQIRTEFRCLYVFNTGGGHISGATLEFTANPALSFISIGHDPAGKGDGRTGGIATSISTEDEAPTGVRFFGEDLASTDGPFDHVTMPLGLLKSGEGFPIWLKRVTEQGSAQIITATLTIEHDAVTLPGDDIDDGGAIGELISAVATQTGQFKIGVAKIGFSDIG